MTNTDIAGYFPPETVTWRVHSDPVVMVAGLRALLLQALHPAAVSGVMRHSGFADDPWGRLARTAQYVTTITYATRPEADRSAARVRGMHQRLGLDDPDLLLWVHCCEVDSLLSVARRAGLRLSDTDADRYVAEQRVAARLVGLPDGAAPGTVADLTWRIDSYRPVLRAGPEAREAARFVLFPPMPVRATPLRPAWAGLAGLAFASLPTWARRLYRTPGLPTTDVGATVGLRALRTALRVVPGGLRDSPTYRAARIRHRVSAPTRSGPARPARG